MENRRYTILLVDDDVKLLKMMTQMLESDYDIIACSDTSDLEHKVDNIQIDLVLLDIVMDGRNGFEICKLLRKRWSKTELPIIFVSSQARTKDLAEGFEAGANDYILKPIRIFELKMSISSNLLEVAVHQKNRERNERQNLDETLTILHLTDNATISKAINLELERADFQVAMFHDPNLALRHFGMNQDKIQTVIVEVNHTQINGYRFFEYLNQIKPDINIFFIVTVPKKSFSLEYYSQYKSLPHFFAPVAVSTLVSEVIDVSNHPMNPVKKLMAI